MTTQVQSAKTQQGFSLIELLVVVAIIGVLAAAGVVGYTSYLDNVKADTHRNNTLAIGKALSLNAVAKNGNLAVNPAACSAATVEMTAGTPTQSGKHAAMLACVRAIALEAKFKSPFAGAGLVTQATIDAYIVEAPTADRNTAFSTATLPNTACNSQNTNNENKGKIVVHHDDGTNTGRMKTTIFACDTPKAGAGSVIIPDSIVQVDYLN